MKTDISSTIVHSEGFQSESFFSIKQDNIAHIFGILRNQLYSNKQLAVIREYCTNAFDAHVDANIPDEPIIVTVPTHITPTLVIRDKGNGLSTEQIYQIFASYGESTKRNTDSQVGMLGLGSKSAFCYVDSFTVTSYNNGVKSVYNAYIDTTQIGKISLTHSEPTDETGLEIKIHVNPYDISTFNYVIFDFLKFFNPKPIILNNDALKRQISDYDLTSILSGSNWKVTRKGDWNNSRIHVTMGNVNYPVSISSLPSHDLRNFLEDFNQYFLYVDVPIGTVKPSASRESLDMNTKTTNALLDTFNKVKEDIQSEYSKKIQSSKSMWEAFQTYQNLNNSLGIKGLNATFQGNPINQAVIKPAFGKLKSYVKPTHGTRNYWKQETSIVPNNNAIIFYHDKSIAFNSVQNRIVQYLDSINDELRNNLHLLSFDNSLSMNSWLIDVRFDGANKIDLATVPYVNPKKRVINKIIKSTAYQYTGYGCRNYSKWFNTTIDLNGKGVYLPIKRSICEDITFKSLDCLLANMKILFPRIQVIGVRYDEVKNLGSGWVHLFDYCIQECNEYIERNGLQDSINRHFAYSGADDNWCNIKCKKIDFGGNDFDIFLSNYTKTSYDVSTLLRIEHDMNRKILKLTDNKYINEFNAIKEKYDLVPAFDMSVFSLLTDEMLIKYVNLVN